MKTSQNTLLLVFLFGNLLLTCSTALSIDFSKTLVESNSQWTRVRLGFAGASKDPVQTYYDEYPVGWNQVINYMYIPADQQSINRKYAMKVRAKDADNNQLNATIVYTVSDSKVYLANTTFEYNQVFDDNFFDSGIFKGRSEMIKANGTAISNIITDSNTFVTQADFVEKLNSISQTPGAGIVDYIVGSVNINQSVPMANVEVANKMRSELRTNLMSQIAGNQTNNTVKTTTSAVTIDTSAKTLSIQPSSNIANIQQVIPSQEDVSNQNQKQIVLVNNIIKNDAAQISQKRTIQSIFSKLPGPQELDSIILSADSVAIVQTIQKVIQSDLTCEQKMCYLSDFFGRIQSAISMKAFAATQLNVIIQGAQQQIIRLNTQMENNRKSIDNLGLAELRSKLNQALVQLQDAYTAFNNLENKLQPKYDVVENYKRKIVDLQSSIEANSQQVLAQQLQLTTVNSNIASLEQQLADATAKRNAFQSNINKLQNGLKGYDAKIAEDNANINKTQAIIRQQQQNADNIKIKYQTLEISVERQRTQIGNKEKRLTQINLLIPNLEARAVIEQKKMNTSEITKVKSFISSLQSTLPNIQQQIDDANYKCNQIKQLQISKQRDILTYAIAPQVYNSYIQSCYHVKPDTSNLKSVKISITPVSILDNSWTKSYGAPYSSQSYFSTSDFSFGEDFTCLNPSILESGYGTISKISNKFLEIDNQGKKTILNLGACSRLQSTQSLPKIGQKIYYRGAKIQSSSYNLYRASCV